MIKKEKDGYHIYSHDGSKHLGGPYEDEDSAKKRLHQIEFFKKKQRNEEMTNLKTFKDTNMKENTKLMRFSEFMEAYMSKDYMPSPVKHTVFGKDGSSKTTILTPTDIRKQREAKQKKSYKQIGREIMASLGKSDAEDSDNTEKPDKTNYILSNRNGRPVRVSVPLK